MKNGFVCFCFSHCFFFLSKKKHVQIIRGKSIDISCHYEKHKVWSRSRSETHTCALTHDANKDVSEDERSNTEPQDDVNLNGNRI